MYENHAHSQSGKLGLPKTVRRDKCSGDSHTLTLNTNKKTKDNLTKEVKISFKPNTLTYNENEVKYHEPK